MFTPSGYRELYNNISDKWNSKFTSISELEKRVFEEYKPKTVLDIGCGTGRHCKFFKNIGSFCVGLDISERMAYHSHRKGIPVVIGDLFSPPFKKGSFDAVLLANNIIGNYPESEKVAEIFELAKKHIFVEFKLGKSSLGYTYEENGYEGFSKYWTREDIKEFLNNFKLKFKEEGVFEEKINKRYKKYALFTIFV